MSQESRPERIRHEILTQLAGYRPSALDSGRIRKTAKREGLFDLTLTEVCQEIDYLLGKRLIESQPDPLGAGHKRYKITSAGVDFVEAL